MNLSIFRLVAAFICIVVVFGCNDNNTPPVDKKVLPTTILKVDSNSSAVSSAVWADLKGARFYDTFRASELHIFSNPNKPDTFELKAYPGLIAKSKTSLTIKTAANKVVYLEVFSTNYFVRGIFQPDTLPNGGDEAEEKYMINYYKSLTKEQFEHYAIRGVSEFLGDIFVDKKTLKFYAEANEVDNKELYKSTMKSPSAKIIELPCFACDEGLSLLTYSTKDSEAVVILSSD